MLARIRYRSFQLAFNLCKIAGLNALVIHPISVASSVRASNGCPGSNPRDRRTHLLPTAVGHSVIYGPVLAAEQGVEEGLLAAKEEGGVFREVADD